MGRESELLEDAKENCGQPSHIYETEKYDVNIIYDTTVSGGPLTCIIDLAEPKTDFDDLLGTFVFVKNSEGQWEEASEDLKKAHGAFDRSRLPKRDTNHPFFLVGFKTKQAWLDGGETEFDELPEELKITYPTAEEAVKIARQVVNDKKQFAVSVWNRDTGKQIDSIAYEGEEIKVGDIVTTKLGTGKVVGAGRGVLTVFSDEFGEKVFLETEVSKGGELTETTESGCKLTRGFTLVDGGALFNKMLAEGYKELYYAAAFNWGAVNIPKKELFTFTEGDTALIECDSYDKLQAEAQSHIDFLIKMGTSSSAYGEWEALKKEFVVLIDGGEMTPDEEEAITAWEARHSSLGKGRKLWLEGYRDAKAGGFPDVSHEGTVYEDGYDTYMGSRARREASAEDIAVGDTVKVIGDLMSYHKWAKGKIGEVTKVTPRTGMPPEYTIKFPGGEVFTWNVEKVESSGGDSTNKEYLIEVAEEYCGKTSKLYSTKDYEINVIYDTAVPEGDRVCIIDIEEKFQDPEHEGDTFVFIERTKGTWEVAPKHIRDSHGATQGKAHPLSDDDNTNIEPECKEKVEHIKSAIDEAKNAMTYYSIKKLFDITSVELHLGSTIAHIKDAEKAGQLPSKISNHLIDDINKIVDRTKTETKQDPHTSQLMDELKNKLFDLTLEKYADCAISKK